MTNGGEKIVAVLHHVVEKIRNGLLVGLPAKMQFVIPSENDRD